MAHDVFISYSSQDKSWADAVVASLEANGIRCWIAPRDILPGADWGESLVEAIEQAGTMVLLLSGHANTSPQIRREIERAVDAGIPVIPLRIEDVQPSRSLQYFIGPQHWLDAWTPPLEQHLHRLTESVKALLSKRLENFDAARREPGLKLRAETDSSGSSTNQVFNKSSIAEKYSKAKQFLKDISGVLLLVLAGSIIIGILFWVSVYTFGFLDHLKGSLWVAIKHIFGIGR